MHQSLHVGRLLLLGSVVWAAGLRANAAADTIYYYEPHTGHREAVDANNPGRFATPQTTHARVGGGRGGSLTFNVTYDDITMNTNAGFDDPSVGATRQATLQAVLAYVDDVLNATSGATIDVRANQSEAGANGPLASAGSFYSGAVMGFRNGFCFEHIMTGTDPSGIVVDIQLTVDFGYPWNSDMGPVGGGEFDLFTVLLHEITHGLGFLGLTESDGTSSIGGGNPGQYAVLNQLTRMDDSGAIGSGSTTALWTTAGGASFVGTPANLTSGRLVFTGANAVAAYGSNPTIYSNSPFADGTSLGHWGNDLIGSAVMPGTIFNGTEIRDYAAFEVGALVDLGYTNASVSGPPPPPDSDQDLLIDDDEVIEGTNPNDPDTDDDGVMDGIEVDLGTDPLDNLDFPILPLTVTAILAVAMACVAAGSLIRMKRKTARTR